MENNRISTIKPYTRAIMKAHLCSCGYKYKDFNKPIIAVANSWNEIVPGHIHLDRLAAAVKEGVEEAGGLALEFNTIALCDGIAQGHAGMRYSLPSREVITDSVEVMVKGHGLFDGMVALSSCDKIVPGMLMAAARLNIPSIVVLGGVMPNFIKPSDNKKARQQFLNGEINEEQLVEISNQYYPSAGACPFLGTANTMQGLTEALGMGLPGTSWLPALSDEQLAAAREAGRKAVEMVHKNIRPKDIMTHKAFENAIALLLAMGGSLNACLHLPAIAHELGIDLAPELFDEISRKIPFIAGVTPNNNEYTTNDLHRAGGMPALMKELEAYLHMDELTVTMKTQRENVADAKVLDRNIIYSAKAPIGKEGGVALLKGNIAANGAFIKQSAVPAELMVFKGNARVFNSEEDFLEYYDAGKVQEHDAIVIRYEGPQGGPGMREMHRCTEVIAKYKEVALITDGRFSGASSGLSIGYLSPEAATGGDIALVEDGDMISINVANRDITLEVSDAVLSQRREKLEILKKEASKFLRMYASNTMSATYGAIRKEQEGGE